MIGGHFLDADAQNVLFIVPDDEPALAQRLSAALSSCAHPTTIVGALSMSSFDTARAEHHEYEQTVFIETDGNRRGTVGTALERGSAPIVDRDECGRLFEQLLDRPLDGAGFDAASVVAAELLLAQGFGAATGPIARSDAAAFVIGQTPFAKLPYTEVDQLEVTIVVPGKDLRFATAVLASHVSRGYPDTAVFCAMTGTGSVDRWAGDSLRSASALHEAIDLLDERAATHSAYVPGITTCTSNELAAPGSSALSSPRPTVTIVDGALVTAKLLGLRPAFVTVSDTEAEATRSLLANRWASVDTRVLSLESQLSVTFLHPDTIAQHAQQLCREALSVGMHDAIALASPGLSNLALSLRGDLGVAVIDGVTAAIGLAESLLALNRRP